MILGKRIAFSLVEILVALIIVSLITAALAPVITKKLSSAGITIGAGGTSEIEFQMDCSAFSEDCALCFEEKCTLCTKNCADNEFTSTPDCTCKLCNGEDGFKDCDQCTSKKCKKCLSGYGLNPDNTCKECEIGYYSDGTHACKASPVGTYVDLKKQSNYKNCPIGTYQDKTAQSSCITCPSGTYQNEEGKSSCKTCEIDYMCTGGNNRVQCATNKGANAGSSSCSNCPNYCADCQVPGTCLKCNAGYYLLNGGCNSCPSGYSCDGTTTQTKCSAGYYAAGSASSCTKCGAGTYSAAGAGSCQNCSIGYMSSAGASSCTKCGAGTYNSSAGSSSCTTCPAGYSCSGGSNITQCAAGTYSAGSSSSCSNCLSSNCASCNSTTGACTSCNSGYTLNASNVCEIDNPCGDSAVLVTLSNRRMCITKFNAGDAGFSIPADVKTTYVNGTSIDAEAHPVCFMGATSGTACDAADARYSGCNRTVCNFHGATLFCNKLTYANRTWQIPSYADWNQIIQENPSYLVGKATNSLLLCNYGAEGINSRCDIGTKCKNAALNDLNGGRYGCIPHLVWVRDTYEVTHSNGLPYGYAYALNITGQATGIEGRIMSSAHSVRCVSYIN